MLQESWLSRWTFYRYSRSISQRSSLSWIITRNRTDGTKVQRYGRTCKEDHTYHLSTEEFKKSQGQWYLTLNNSGKHMPMIIRPDFRAAVSLKNRLHRGSGEQVAEPTSPGQYRRWHPSSSTSWWDKPAWHWKGALFLKKKNWSSFFYSWFPLQSIAIHCSRRGV